jgi:hypothetical protein
MPQNKVYMTKKYGQIFKKSGLGTILEKKSIFNEAFDWPSEI